MKHSVLFFIIVVFSFQAMSTTTLSEREKEFEFQPAEQCMAIVESGYKATLRIDESSSLETLQKLWLCDNSEVHDESTRKVKANLIYNLVKFSGNDNKEKYYSSKEKYCSKEITTEKNSNNFHKMMSTLPRMSQEAYKYCQTNLAIGTAYAQSLSCVIWSEDRGRHVFIDLLPHTETGSGSITDLNYKFQSAGIFTSTDHEVLPGILNSSNMSKYSEQIKRSFPLTVKYPRRIMLYNSAPEDRTKEATIIITGLTEYEKREVECSWSWRAFDDVEVHFPKPKPPKEKHCVIKQHIEEFQSDIYKHKHRKGAEQYREYRRRMDAKIKQRRDNIIANHTVAGDVGISAYEHIPRKSHRQVIVKMYWNEKVCSDVK